MENLKKRKAFVIKALATLEISIENYKRAQKLTLTGTELNSVFLTNDELMRTVRDSMIQRFEFSIDTWWKFLKNYLVAVEKINLDLKSPRAVFRNLCQTRLITEQETEAALYMVDSRNITSHIYKEEIADQISKNIKKYHLLMTSIIQRINI